MHNPKKNRTSVAFVVPANVPLLLSWMDPLLHLLLKPDAKGM